MKRFVSLLVLLLGAAAGAGADEPGPGYDIEMSRMIPMRDGVELEAWITRPSQLKAPVPAILELTQYDIDGGRRGDPPIFARTVTCSCRHTCAGADAPVASRATTSVHRSGATATTWSSGSRGSPGATARW